MQITTATQSANAMTPSELQAAIEANTCAIAQLVSTSEQTNQALNFLVTEFIRPNTQQHLQSMERLERLERIVESTAQQQQAIIDQQTANAQQIAQNAEAVTRYDQRLEETRQLVAQNASTIAQNETRHSAAMDRIDQQQLRTGQQVEAIAEASRTQLAAIIGNGRRIDRLEQQAS